MRITKILALFLTLIFPCVVFAQRTVKPRPSATPAPARPSAPYVPPPMTTLQDFYYRIAIYGHAKFDTYGHYYDDVDTYAEQFYSDNYNRAMADKFERNRYRARIRAKIDEEVKKVNFSQKFSSIDYEKLGEYSFQTHSFPMGSRGGVNGNQFASSLPLSEADANAFVKSRASGSGNINRNVKVRTIYSVVNDGSHFIYSVEVFADEGMTRKLGDIRRNDSLPKTGEEWSLASTAAQTPTKEIGKYGYMASPIYYSLGERRVGRLALTDVGYTLFDGNHAISYDNRTKIDCKFYNYANGRISRSKYSDKISFVRAEWFLVNVNGPCVNGSIPFETEQERERFLADLTGTLREWKTKYEGYQFAAGELSIEGETRLYRFPTEGCVVVKVYAAPLFFYPKGGEVIITPPSPMPPWRDRPGITTQPPSGLETGDYKICRSDTEASGIEIKN